MSTLDKNNSKFRLFIENFFVYGFGGIICKIIPLIMVPIVTRLMPSADYFGISDLSNTVVSFGSAFAIMGMYDAMYRMFFENEEQKYKRRVCSTALVFTIVNSIIVFFVLLLGKEIIAQYFFKNEKYAYVVYLSAIATLVGSTNSIISAPTRMENKKKIYLITNALSPLLSYSIAIPLLRAGYYTIALPLAAIISGASMELSFWILNRKWFSIKLFDQKLLKQMLIIALPLLPNFLVYWIFNSCDRVMIVNMIGVGAEGVYSVGSKLGHASQLIYTAFAGGWQFFSFSTMKEKGQVETNSKIFEYLGSISYAATAFICSISYIFYKVLFEEEYLSGYIVAPYLFLAPLLQMLFQVAANQFTIIKKTWPIVFILSGGALANIVINYFFIPLLGIEGAAIATLFGYMIADIICILVLWHMKLMLISKRFIIVSLLMISFFVVWRFYLIDMYFISLLFAFIFNIVIALIHKKEVLFIISKMKKIIHSRV